MKKEVLRVHLCLVTMMSMCLRWSHRMLLRTLLHEWRRLISDVETESAKVDMESAKVQMDIVKLEKESVKVEMESDKLEMCAKVLMGGVKLENESAKVEMESGKLKMCAKVQMGGVKLGKEELDHMASFSDIETNDEACSFQDGVDLRGHSQVEDDDFNEQGLLIVFVIRVGQLLFIKYDVDSIRVHAKVMYDIVQGFLCLLHVDHLSQMDGQRCHLVQKQADDYKNALSPTHGGDQSDQLPQLQLRPLHLARDHDPLHVQQDSC
ncbi:hypothetical protein C2845_PM14G08970 [Panicum miliaceum]|uniref:Uncharacterized protein n=1 Tax=Panicum miliaceum TaxID=4540 RepID=A0A3L6PU45_PANMI|nr:hypothetical protein C2845_PM14G08970 [Panicum miliaceum]